ncbi:MAG: sulfatase [Phycisphaerales bacterium]|nr:MAG: sulfatase [Phycisphaerales bacterium]
MKAPGSTRRDFLKTVGLGAGSIGVPGCHPMQLWTGSGRAKQRPNILFCIADDWSWPHASIAGDKVVKTPTFDRVAREGILFDNAFVTAPSCTPSRGSIVTGQWHWRLEEGGNLWSTLPSKFAVYPDLLEAAGYHVGYTRKGWGPGRNEPGGRTRNPAGPQFKDFVTFLEARPEGTPFCFWFGSQDPHRSYTWESGVQSGMNSDEVEVPACLPDSETVRKDICDYYWEVQRFDREVGELLTLLAERDALDDTMVVITGDNGLPFPRCKSNLYDLGTNVPLAVRWPAYVKAGRTVEDFISLQDLAPTFLEAAGLEPTAEMTGRSFLDILTSKKSGCVDRRRDHVLTGKERHAWVRKDGLGYPCRAIRTHEFLYIRNFKPQRWPAGHPVDGGEPYYSNRAYGDIDGAPSKTYMMEHRDDPDVKRLFELAFEKRPAEELYDLRQDPDQLNNVADRPEYVTVKNKLASTLMAELTDTKDPRVQGRGDVFDRYPYYGGRQPKKT